MGVGFSQTDTESFAFISSAREQRKVRPLAVPMYLHPGSQQGQEENADGKASRGSGFSPFQILSLIHLMVWSNVQLHQFPGASGVTEQAAKSNFCHCNHPITAFYGFHTFLTLQCLCNVELIHQISTQSWKLHDSFGNLHNQTPKPKFHNCVGKDT